MAARLPYQTLKQWKEHGLSMGYDESSPTLLSRSDVKEERSWARKGMYEGWTKDLEFKGLRSVPWKTLEQWKEHGLNMNYDQKNYASLRNSKDEGEKSWLNKGGNAGWIKEFPFKVAHKNLPYQTFEQWKEHGLKMKYNERMKRTLDRSKEKEERSWYVKGRTNKWTEDFDFKENSPWQNIEEWKKHGIDKGFNNRAVNTFRESKDSLERRWFYRGNKKGWINSFDFDKVTIPSPYKSFEEWEGVGLEKGYDKRNPKSLEKSDSREERRWYFRGRDNKWLKDFSFSRINVSPWKNFEQWNEHGLENGYNLRNALSIRKSEDKNERSWYHKGIKHNWVREFSFTGKGKINTPEKLQKFLETNEDAKLVASLSQSSDSTSDLADILCEMYPDKFISAVDLARSLPSAFHKIGSALTPLTIGKARDYAYELEKLPEGIQVKLENVLENILFHNYMNDFNTNPSKVLNELGEYAGNEERFGKLAQKILNEYQNILDFEIPGQGRLGEVA